MRTKTVDAKYVMEIDNAMYLFECYDSEIDDFFGVSIEKFKLNNIDLKIYDTGKLKITYDYNNNPFRYEFYDIKPYSVNKYRISEVIKKTNDQFPDDSIDLLVTSPPYDNIIDYKGYSFDFEGIAKQLCRILKPGGVIVWAEHRLNKLCISRK
jgi:hypothetical protein